MKNKQLHNIKSTGFKTPDNYFESFDESLFLKLSENELTSKIDSSGFKVPDNYFETFDDKVIKAIEENEATKIISLGNWKKIIYVSGIAASLVLVFNLLFATENELTFSDLETASIEYYLINEELSAYEIAPYLGSNELDSDDFIDTKMKASDIEAYLLQNSDVEHLITD